MTGLPRAHLAVVFLLLTLSAGKGAAGEGVVALQTAEPSCADPSGDIYVDCGNGTVTDTRSGLVWLKNTDCFGEVDWHTAMELVAGLSDQPATSAASGDDCGLSDGSSPGEWRLPSIEEWQAMVEDGQMLGCSPMITDDQGTGCWSSDPLTCSVQGRSCSFSGVRSNYYWSASSGVTDPDKAWDRHLLQATVPELSAKGFAVNAWPVRSGQ